MSADHRLDWPGSQAWRSQLTAQSEAHRTSLNCTVCRRGGTCLCFYYCTLKCSQCLNGNKIMFNTKFLQRSGRELVPPSWTNLGGAGSQQSCVDFHFPHKPVPFKARSSASRILKKHPVKLKKKINKQSIIGIEKSFIWTKPRTTGQETSSRATLRNCSGEALFSAVFCLVRSKNIT